jgi:hypothetical protein
MANGDSKRGKNGRAGFRIATGPLIRRGDGEADVIPLDVVQLPRTYGAPILFAIPRDPRTLFTYWNIDWEAIFAKVEPPVGRNVYLRVLRANGTEESESLVEPLLGNYYTAVSRPRGIYRVELGYYQPAGAWNSVGISDAVQMPPEDFSEDLDVDVATVPFHLSFQRMIDFFRASSGDPITTIISRLQDRALTEDEKDLLSDEEWEILHAMDLSLSDVESARRQFAGRDDQDRLRRRAEAVLGFGGTSPTTGFGGASPTAGFGGSSWGSSPS